jgi:hypothetical protein
VPDRRNASRKRWRKIVFAGNKIEMDHGEARGAGGGFGGKFSYKYTINGTFFFFQAIAFMRLAFSHNKTIH